MLCEDKYTTIIRRNCCDSKFALLFVRRPNLMFVTINNIKDYSSQERSTSSSTTTII